jgi:hypothetical protein
MALQPAQPVEGAPVNPPPPPSRTYREVFANTAGDLMDGRPAEYLYGYRFVDEGAGGVPTPANLRTQAVQHCDRRAMAFLCLVQTPDLRRTEVRILHRFLHYLEMPGEAPTGFNDKVLALLGDVQPHQYPTVEVPNTAFHLIGQAAVRVPTLEAMPAVLPGWADDGTALGPYTEQDPGTELVRPRHLQLLPNRYAALLVHRTGVGPKRAYEELAGVIAADNFTEPCSDVLTWLRAACTARGGGGAQSMVSGVLHSFTPVHLPPPVYDYVATKIAHDLPGTTGPAAVREAVPDLGLAAQIAAAMQAVNNARGGDGDERPEPKERSIAEAYKETYRVLLRFGNVNSVDEVAPVWRRLANAHKSEQITILSQEFNKVCMSKGLATDLYSPVVTSQVRQMVVSFQFVGLGADDLSTGCQPFLVSYSGGAHHQQTLDAAMISNQLLQGDQNPSLSDWRALRESEKLRPPRDAHEVGITLQRFAVLAQCLFQGAGAGHPLVETLWALASSYQNQLTYLVERSRMVMHQHPGVAATYYARIVRHVQLRVHDYLQAVATSVADTCAGVEAPNFQPLLQDLRYGTFHHSSNWAPLPEAYMGLGPAPAPTVAAHLGSNGSTPSRVSASEGSASRGSSVSSITETTRVARVDNPTDDREFTGLTLRSGIGNLLRSRPPPSNDAGHEFCVAWWCKKGCFPTCGRRMTHVPFASPTERTRLLEFVRTNLTAPAAGT